MEATATLETGRFVVEWGLVIAGDLSVCGCIPLNHLRSHFTVCTNGFNGVCTNGVKSSLVTISLPPSSASLQPHSEVTGARALTQMPGAHRSSGGDHAFFDAAPCVGCLLMMMPRPARRS